ncbi:MAG: 30S ribosomal protein S2 [Ignavibacteria bacterium CG2_30_36_16]|nr:30S ribosomal protein S2 [Ignavibacteria bacterium]OIP55383.1 MAG: 30S ribosomal protein S2 [Ignavibacteria bacterium CG2_30_36_16]PJB02397.1 MAG: 30S ribosomal protein S2 [Ignavibacteria bacterium CG_4_9_14_3_um_filter_36_18]
MKKIDLVTLIESGAHFGHLTRRWNPKMKPYIFMEKNGIHIIDVKKTMTELDKAATAIGALAAEGKKVLFVGTKKQAKNILEVEARKCDAHWVSERWLGGMLTNFSTIRKNIKRLHNIEKSETDGTFEKITKKERLFLTREKDKLKQILEGIEDMSRLPGAMFVVDIKKEAIAVKEAKRLGIPVFAIVDTNCDPDPIDYVIPANDDAVKTIEFIVNYVADAVQEGTARAKELKAEEAAVVERERKVREEGRKEEKETREFKRKPRENREVKDKKEEPSKDEASTESSENK